MMNDGRIPRLNDNRMSTLTIRLPEQALARLVLTLAFAAFVSGERHKPAAVRSLAMDQPAITVTPPLSGDGCEGVPQRTVAASPSVFRSSYLVALTWCFTFFSTVRMLAYLPTVVSIVQHGDSSQHSLWTWLTWLGANLTMAAWLYEENGARINKAVVVSAGNAAMCLATSAVIIAFRL